MDPTEVDDPTRVSRPETGASGPDGYFEDFPIGRRMRHARGATVGEVENNYLSKAVMNTAQGHWNEDYMRGSPLGDGRLVFGLITASMVIGLSSQDTAAQAVRELGLDAIRLSGPVHQSDTLYAYSEVLDARPAEDREDAGVVAFRHWGVTADGRVVFSGDRTVLIKKRSHRPVSDPVKGEAGR